MNLMNELYTTKLTDAIGDLDIVERFAVSDKERATFMLFMINEYTSNIIGGNEEVRRLMDEYTTKFNRVYRMVRS